jgi:nucleoside-diphosphate-sugar epimerase
MASKVAVLGAAGCIGSILTKYLQSDGYEVLPVTRDVLNLNDSYNVKNWLIENRPDVVINCATAGGKLTVNDIIYEDIQNNTAIFLNFYNNSDLFGKFINVGSGAEFDMSRDLNQVSETEILASSPTTSYGYSKNIIARWTLTKDNFYTLRLFGCFDPSEPEFRLLKRCMTQDTLTVENKQFDFISAKDYYQVVKHYVNNQVSIKDINCVYQEKYDLLTILEKFVSYHNLNIDIVTTTSGKNYTGNGDRLASLNLPLEGLELGLKNYK